MDGLVSFVIPVHNSGPWLNDSLESILNQQFPHSQLEVSLFEDLSSDNSWDLMVEWEARFCQAGIRTVLGRNVASQPQQRGCGYARNQAIEQSTGEWLCFMDADDVSTPNRVSLQLEEALRVQVPCIVGSGFTRMPVSATPRFTEWHSSLQGDALMLQRFKEVTIIQPSWFMHRTVFQAMGGFETSWPGTPEDMIFFYRWIESGGFICKVQEPLVIYRWHENATSLGVHRSRLLKEKVIHFEREVLSNLDALSIWSVGRDGKKFFMTLSQEAKQKVVCFCDVNPSRVGQTYHDVSSKRNIPIVHYSTVRPPVAICVAVNRCLAGRELGEVEANIASMGWQEGID